MSGNDNQNRLDFGHDASINGDVIGRDQINNFYDNSEEITSRKLTTNSPYKGLNTFDSSDKDLFFGRDNFIKTLEDELEQTNLILLLGASGSGKSSVVRAGLIPKLDEKYRNVLKKLIFIPDKDPFLSFHGGLQGAKFKQADIEIAREVKAETLIKVVRNLKQQDEFWFIFIDQFEELFTISDENKCREFIDGLMKLSQDKLPNVNNNLKIMATMRADFLERLSDFPRLVKATQKYRPMIVEMQRNELRSAIVKPATHHGVSFEDGLVDRIIDEIDGQAGYLPLLQYTLNLLWKEEAKTGSIDDQVLKISTYEKLGGVKGALQKHVDQIYENLSSSKQKEGAIQRIFLRLVEIGENAEAGIEWKPVRRRVQLSEFTEDLVVLRELVDENLLVSSADLSATDSNSSRELEQSHAVIEITHEILLTSWDKLHGWIKENRQGIALRNRLYEDVKRWQAKKPEDELWTGSKLEQVLELRKDNNFNRVLGGFTAEANQFIVASVGVRDRQLRRARRNATIGFTLAGLASVASVLAFIQQQEAQKRRIIGMIQISESRLLASQEFEAMKEAIKANKELNNLWIKDANTRTQVELALLNTVHSLAVPNTLGEHADQVSEVSFSPDGQMLASASRDNTVKLWAPQTGEEINTLTGHTDWVWGVSFSPDGQMLASASRDNTVKLWNLDFDYLLKEGCDFMRGYWKYNPPEDESEKNMCDGVGDK